MTEYRNLIAVDELRKHLDDPRWTVVDCRFNLMQPDEGFEEYRQDHIPGARYADLDKDLASPVTELTGRHPLPLPEIFAETLGGWGIGNNTQVVVYDHGSGAVAARLWWLLKWLGHESVAVLNGGYAAWKKAGLRVSDEIDPIEVAGFRPEPDAGLIISTGELLNLIEAGHAPLIVDARDTARFEGRAEPIDSAAGHIPGAANHPFSEALQADGHWKGPEELREGWQSVFGERYGQVWVSMCGSGVTACHLALSADVAGIPPPRLYVGSWSEWIRDPGRPIATDGD